MSPAEVFSLLLIFGMCASILIGFPISFTLAGTSLFIAGLGWLVGDFAPSFLGFLPSRIYGVMTSEVLLAIPLFVFMGLMLERSKVAEELLVSMGRLFGPLRGGLGISVSLVGALLAASTGIVGATVVTMGLLSLPTMLRRGYDPQLACGSIAAAGTLGQIIPPSIVLVVLGDQISNAYDEAQRALGNFAPEPVSVGDLFAGALFPGLSLVGMYILYQLLIGWLRPETSPPIPKEDLGDAGGSEVLRLAHALIAPLVLIVAVLGSILVGLATPTEAAAVGAIGATFLGGLRISEKRLPVYIGAGSLIAVLILTGFVDLRLGRAVTPLVSEIGIIVAFLLCLATAWGLLACLAALYRQGMLTPVMRTTARFSSMVFVIVIAARMFSTIFRGFGGDIMVEKFLGNLPGGAFGAMLVVMFVVFIMGFFMDVIEITFVVVPIVAPILLKMNLNPVWLGVMFGVNLQTSFLTPPFGYALFYLRGVAPPEVTTMHIYRGIIPFVIMQLLGLVVLSLFPEMATWLPKVVFG